MSAEGGNIEILIKQRSELNVLNLSLKPSCFRGIFSSFAWTLLFVFLFLYDMTSDSFPSRLYDLYVFKLNPIHVLTPKTNFSIGVLSFEKKEADNFYKDEGTVALFDSSFCSEFHRYIYSRLLHQLRVASNHRPIYDLNVMGLRF